MTVEPPRSLMPRKARGLMVRAAVVSAMGVLVAFLALPFLALLLRVSPAQLLARLGEPVVLDALRLSLLTSAAATLVVVALGVPVAYAARDAGVPRQARRRGADRPAHGAAPHRGGLRAADGVRPHGTRRARAAAPSASRCRSPRPAWWWRRSSWPCRSSSGRRARASPAWIAGCSTPRPRCALRRAFTFFRVVLPLAMPSLLAGVAMSCARALGEFGATITFAGNLPGHHADHAARGLRRAAVGPRRGRRALRPAAGHGLRTAAGAAFRPARLALESFECSTSRSLGASARSRSRPAWPSATVPSWSWSARAARARPRCCA